MNNNKVRSAVGLAVLGVCMAFVVADSTHAQALKALLAPAGAPKKEPADELVPKKPVAERTLLIDDTRPAAAPGAASTPSLAIPKTIGRFQGSVSEGQLFLFDTVTGQVWRHSRSPGDAWGVAAPPLVP